MQKRLKKHLYAVTVYLFSGAAAVAGVYAAVLLILFGCGIKPYIVLSGSMEPVIKTGSLCLIDTKAEFERVQEGDVIAFETSAGVLVTHRALRIQDGMIETKGDANDVSDGFSVNEENFCGNTLISVPYLGYIHYALRGKRGLVISLVAVAAACLLRYGKFRKSAE